MRVHLYMSCEAIQQYKKGEEALAYIVLPVTNMHVVHIDVPLHEVIDFMGDICMIKKGW